MIRVADLFCGAGGATTGVYQAARTLGVPLDVLAINHWPVAVETHQQNFPDAKHLCMSVESVDPRAVVPSGHLHLLVAGVECTHHSNARGGRPINDQSRASAWNVMRWCELLRVDHVLIENVPEFQSWGPLTTKMRPVKGRKGETYRAFLAALASLGYTVEARVLNAADYGDATTRKRLFIQAVRGKGPIAWPEPTHSQRGSVSLLRSSAKWRAAREVIDWSLPSKSIFERTKALSPNTLKRIEAGLRRFGARPFVLQQQSGGAPRLTSEPIPTIATKGAVSLVEPFVVQLRGTADGQIEDSARSLDDPLSTVSASGAHHALVEPFIITPGGADLPNGRSVNDPLPTVTCSDRFALVEPFIVPYYGPKLNEQPRSHSISEPLPTLTTENRFGLVEPFIVVNNANNTPKSLDDPLPTVTGGNRHYLVEPFTMPYCSNGGALARPVSQPLGTVTTRDRFALVIPDGMDIRFRMLQPHELSAAMGFPVGYQFAGNKGDIVRQIGNAWACHTATALCRVILGKHANQRVKAIA